MEVDFNIVNIFPTPVHILDVKEFKDTNNYHHNYWFPPIEGRMLIFPSHLQHEVKKNLSNEDRISASFNIKLENKKIVWLE